METFIKDIQSFKQLYIDHFKAVIGFCDMYINDKNLAMDITQESFFRLYQNLNAAYNAQNALAFIYITAKNQCMDHLRHRKFKMVDVEDFKDQLPSDQFFLEELTRQEMINHIHLAIKKLSGRSYQIVQLALAGKSNQQIAEELNISINSVKSLKKEMYTKLRNLIGNEYIILFIMKNLLQL